LFTALAAATIVLPRLAHGQMSDLLIGERSMGRVSLGMRAGEAQSQYPAPLTRNAVLLQEGDPQAAIEILDTGSAVLMTAELIGDRVVRIRTMNARLSTKNGLRVGAPFRDAQRMYGEPLLTGGEDGLIAVYRLDARLVP
jgi:hypothetical protein